MNPYRPCRLSAGADEDELLRRRHVEIAALRRALDVFARGVRKLGEEVPALLMAELQSELKKYNPGQPRVPKGNHGGGQWTNVKHNMQRTYFNVGWWG